MFTPQSFGLPQQKLLGHRPPSAGHRTHLIVSILLAVLCCSVALPPCIAAESSLTPKVTVVQAPEKCLVPDVLMDSSGVLHMVYGLEHHAYYTRSKDNGTTFTSPVKVNSTGLVETKMGERGPKLAVGKDGAVHVVWLDEWAPGVKTYVRYSRSLDGGESFEPVKALSSMSGVDGVTVAADVQGNVVSFWHVMADPKPEVKSATWLYTTRSADNGATFQHDEKGVISNLSGLACSMCMMRARAVDGNVYLAFRSAQDSIRDFFVLQGRATQNRFTADRVNVDNWKIDFCPMCGPELTLGADGQSLCAFMSRNKVYWAVADSPGAAFRLHVPTPTNEENEIYPSAVANRKGQVLLVWQVGPMATKGTANVKWAIYGRDGKPTGQAGDVGKSFAGTKAAAFVGTDDNFYVVTTATKSNAP